MKNKTKCPICLQEKSFGIKFDKRNRPYFKCEMCSHRIFVQGYYALATILGWCKVLEGLNKEKVRTIIDEGKFSIQSLSSSDEEVRSYVEHEEFVNV